MWKQIVLLIFPPDKGVFCIYWYFNLCLIKLSLRNLNSGNELALVLHVVIVSKKKKSDAAEYD